MSDKVERTRSKEAVSRLKIEPAGSGDIEEVWRLVKSASDWLLEQGMNHWDLYYSREKTAEKLESNDVYLARIGSKAVGTVSLSEQQVEYYTEEDMGRFADPDARAIYVTALAVNPDQHKKGIASQLMAFVENETRKRGIEYVRFDCRARYKDLVSFYEKRGYEIKGEFVDEADNNEPYDLMEKKV